MSARPNPFRHYRTKRYARRYMQQSFREWARMLRMAQFGLDRYQQARNMASCLIGARSALFSVGALTDQQYERYSQRWKRIHRATITRRPTAQQILKAEGK